MSSLNKAMIIGNLGKDPEIFESSSGIKVAKFSVATSEHYKGEEKTEWHNVALFGKVAEVAEKYLKKGSKIYVEGKMETRKYEDKQGVTRYSFQIKGSAMQMLGGSKAVEQNSYAKEDGVSYFDKQKESSSNTQNPEFDDEIPF